MKKISLTFAVLVAALGFSSCNETWDDNPTLNTHEGVVEANFLNEPVLQNTAVNIGADDVNGTLHFTCSQPDFGYAAAATYRVQISLDKVKYKELAMSFYDCSEINPVNSEVAKAISSLAGVVSDADLPLNVKPVYFRLRAYIPELPESTQFISNWVSMNDITISYLAIWVAGTPTGMYLRGGMNDWGSPDEWEFKQAAEDYSYEITNVTIAGGTEFKVADSAWDKINMGAGDQGSVVSPGVPYTLNAGENPGNLSITSDFTGRVYLQLVQGTYILTLDPAH